VNSQPTEANVLELIATYPADMIHDIARGLTHNLSTRDVEYILASHYLAQPRVIRRTVSEGLRTVDRV
jgi:hypothetical protein